MPQNAITVIHKNGFFRPKISEDCIECGKCININHCPGYQQSKLVSYKCFKNVLYGHSTNEFIRKEAASGGLTTELLKYMLDNDVIDRVVTAGVYHNDKNLGYTVIDKNSASDLYKHSGSNYCPANIGRAIKKIKQEDGRYAIVCLPCLAREINNLRKIDAMLNERIKYVICLLCNHVPSYEATDYLIEKYKVGSLSMVKYRGNGWFGNFRAFDKPENGTEIFSVPFSEYFATKFSENFWQKSCVSCNDHFGLYADACMGDADFVKYHSDGDNYGETIVFSNNDEIITLIDVMHQKGILGIEKDVSDDDLEWIYGPISVANRASDINTRTGYKDILRQEQRQKWIADIKAVLNIPKRLLHKIIRELKKYESE